MIKTFIVHNSGVDLECDGQSFDLHNRYDFSAFRLNGATAVLAFHPNPEYGHGLPPILVEFEGVDYSLLNLEFGSRDQLILDEIGYKAQDDNDLDWLDGELNATCASHLVYRFVGGGYIRLHAAKVKLRVGSSAV